MAPMVVETDEIIPAAGNETNIVIQAIKNEDEKIKSLKELIEKEKNRLAALNRLVQLHQGTLAANSTSNVPADKILWLGSVPSVESVDALTQLLENDLSMTTHFSGYSINNCRVLHLNATEDIIHKLYEVTLKVASFTVEITFESNLQVTTGIEKVSAVQKLSFLPALPELAAFQHHVTESCCIYLIPRGLHTLLKLESAQQEVVDWSRDQINIEVATSARLSLVLNYVPFGKNTSGTPKILTPQKSPVKYTAKKTPPGKENRRTPTAVKQELSLKQKTSGNITADDACVTLRWTVAYSRDLRNFRHRFGLHAPQAVQERYSQNNAILPLLRGEQDIRSASDVIKLFSTLSH
ncbi:uncharacterized protein LOC108677208 [Hyalella azteca]|uniref:Uncharacterized protein LOC108677208 n=1 Tax=Hyalella azteca TaxID=294128 RepID=A0A8B7P4L0_HYAAZ|nr:uncharacterized protein LOC108677208 [Hyalella azteca]